jgi:hypothetical protein
LTKDQRLATWVLASGALMVIGAFGPWLKIFGLSVSGTDGSNDGWFVVVAGLLGSLLFYLARERMAGALWPVVAGLVGVFTTLHDRQHFRHAIDQGGIFGQELIKIGWGLYLALFASASMAVAGIVWGIRGNS